MLYTTMNSPVGELLLVGDETALRGLHFANHRYAPDREHRSAREPFAAAREQLEQYFAGERREFELPLALDGPAFHRRVWEALLTIPYGETRSYGEIATQVGDHGSARAVGFANGRNPVAIVVPCHRVIGADGSLTGYGGGLPRKRQLLDLEAGRLALTA
jgi:methylated-DNA-[protein]-cysteine S-methyltransferase